MMPRERTVYADATARYGYEVVDNHGFVPSLLLPGGAVLDVGARGMRFARNMAARGMRVVAMDPDPDAADEVPGVAFLPIALVGTGSVGVRELARWDNGEGNYLIVPERPPPARANVVTVDTVDVTRLMQIQGISHWELVKLNCEGSEYDILGTWPGPIASQIGVSFHDHAGANPGGQGTYDRILAHLGQWYDVVRHVWEERYCAGFSFWDSLFILR